jgi:hypothetical protein
LGDRSTPAHFDATTVQQRCGYSGPAADDDDHPGLTLPDQVGECFHHRYINRLVVEMVMKPVGIVPSNAVVSVAN